MSKRARRPLVLVTGMSGAGKSTALKVLEDLGYEVVDNLPLKLLGSLVHSEQKDGATVPLAACIDSRTRGFDAAHFERYVEPLLDDESLDVTLFFLDCDDEVLRRRFTETRRRHPLAYDRPVSDGISRERALLSWFRSRADLSINTSGLSIRDFAAMARAHFRRDIQRKLSLFVLSFAYRQGLPLEADLVFDVRFLANPHYEPDLRELTGRDPAVANYIEQDPAFAPFFERLVALVESLLPAYEREGKSYLTIAIGCTGGRHRSVFTAERLVAALGGADRPIDLRHRELKRAGDLGSGAPPTADGVPRPETATG